MSGKSRTRRPFRPENIALEGRNLVSALNPWNAGSDSDHGGAGDERGREQAGASRAAKPGLTSFNPSIGTSFAWPSSTNATDPETHATRTDPGAAVTLVDGSGSGMAVRLSIPKANGIAITSITAPLGKSSGPAQTNGLFNGGGRSSDDPAMCSATPPAGSIGGAQLGGAWNAGIIRPMSLAAGTDASPAGTMVVRPESGGGGGNPAISAASSGGGSVIMPAPSAYQFSSSLYIGTRVTLSITPAADMQSITWTPSDASGFWNSYPVGGAVNGSTSIPTAVPVQTVPNQNASYAFNVGPTPNTYMITVKETFTDNPVAGVSTFQFTSVAPKTATMTMNTPKVETYNDGTNVGFTMNTSSLAPAAVPPTFTATTALNPSTVNNQAGSFFFMQLVSPERFLYDKSSPSKVTYTRDPAFPTDGLFELDDAQLQSIAYPYKTKSPMSMNGVGNFTWTDSQQEVATMVDGVTSTALISTYNIDSIQDEQYQTYLMFQPSGGTAVAMQEIDWGWTAKAYYLGTGTNYGFESTAGASLNLGDTFTIPSGTASQPSGAAAFPSWYGRTSQAKSLPF